MPEPESVRGDVIKVVYTLTVDDLAALSRLRVLRRYGGWEPVIYWTLILAFLAYGIWKAMQGRTGGFLIDGSVPIAAAVLMLAFRFFLGPMIARVQFRSLRMGEHPVHLTVDGEALTLEIGPTDSRMAWSALKKADRTERHYFFWINKLQAIIVPLRAFDNEMDRDRLWTLANQKLDKTDAG